MPVTSPEDLYGLPLADFVPERTALVKALRAQKRRDDAGAAAALRKPSVAAWAVNQLVRTQKAALRTLFKAGDGLVQAQSRVAAGDAKPSALRTASERQREAIDALIEAAEGLLGSAGHPLTAATLERVRETLRAASIDEASRAQVTDGCLVAELEFAGLGLGDLGGAVAAGSPRSTPEGDTPKPEQSKAEAAQQRKDKATAARERRAALATARRAESSAERAATRADKALAAAQSQAEDAEDALRAARERLSEATDQAAAAQEELEAARAAVAELDA